MELKNLKIEICELPDEMDLLEPSWRVYDSETGEDVLPITDEIRRYAFLLMSYCAGRIRMSLDITAEKNRINLKKKF